MSEQKRRWPWRGWRLLGGAPVPPQRRTLRASDAIDASSIGGGPGDPGGGADIARDFGNLPDPFADDEKKPAK